MELLFIALTFGAGFFLVCCVNLMMADMLEASRRKVRQRLQEETRLRQRERVRASMRNKPVVEMPLDALDDVDPRTSLWERYKRFIEESDLRIGPLQLVALSAAVAVASAAAAFFLGGWGLSVVMAPIGAAGPMLWVYVVRRKRLEALLSQLPDAFDLMNRTLRAGQTISQALQAVADEFSPPVAEEFGYCYDQQSLGLSPEASLRDLARRTGLLELKIFVLAVMIHRQTGGNLANLLEKLATLIRRRYRIRGVIKALTAEGRLQAMILLGLPPLMLIVLSIVSRSYMAVLFEYPSLLLAMFAMMAIGGIWMEKIIRFDF